MYGTLPSTSRSADTRSSVELARSTYTARSATPACSAAPRTPSNVRPSLMTTAASVVRKRAATMSGESVPGRTVRTSSRLASGVPAAAAAALNDVTPGITSVS